MIFFNYWFIEAEQHYRSLELEVVCLIWVYKRLRTLLYLNNKCIVILTDHDVIYNIVKNINFNIISIDCANCCLTNISVYLSVYLLDIYYIPGRLNLVPNAFLHFRIIKDDIIRTDNETESTFDTIWDEDNKEKSDNISNNVYLIYKIRSTIKIDNFFLTETIVQINDVFRQRVISIYKKDNIYNKIIQNLYPNSIKANEKILKVSKFGHLFYFTDKLFYFKDNEHRERLVVLFPFV